MQNTITQFSLLAVLIPLLPLLGFIINGLGFRKLSGKTPAVIGTLAAAASFVCSLVLFMQFDGRPLHVPIYDWIRTSTLDVAFSFYIDQLTLVMLLMVTGIGSLIHLYSGGYMSHDEGYGKFFAFLNLFLFSMLVLVLGSNYVVMFVGWEGVGLCSFLLIGFWNKNKDYNAAARKAFVMNRIGDLGFLLGIFLIFYSFGSSEFSAVYEQAKTVLGQNPGMATAIALLLFVGAMGKSAQLPLFTWLPDAMAGPTPVSALIHAATMVTAGIYMVIRSNVIYVMSPDAMHVVSYIGIATVLVAASIALFQNDIKKVLAYSTVSQLGYMVLALGVGAFTSGLFHVVTHAFFKALLFLGAGSVIHAMSNEQDIRNMGGLRKALPITYATFLIGTIAIAGIPPFSGFFSKDEILANALHHDPLLFVLGLAGALMTAFYMFRLLFLTFNGKFRGTEDQKHHLHESPISMTLPLMVLAVLAVLGGALGLPEALFGHGSHILANWLQPIYAEASTVAPSFFAGHHADASMELTLMGVGTAVALVGLLLAHVIYNSRGTVPAAEGEATGPVHRFLYRKWYLDELYNALFVKPLFFLSEIFYAIIDILIIDLFVNLVGRSASAVGGMARRLQSGSTGFYLMAMVAAIVIIMAFNLFNNQQPF